MSSRTQIIAIVAVVITLAAAIGSVVTGSWLVLIAWLIVALAITIAFFLPKAPARPIYDESGAPTVCPNCGSSTFYRVRSSRGVMAGFLIFGWLGALFAPKSQIRCSSCGATYPRQGG